MTYAKLFRSTALGLVAAAGLVSGCAAQESLESASVMAPATAQVAVDGYVAEDEMFATPYIDVQEWRDGPVRHYYVHGGFEGTDTRFSYYLPEEEQYEGRFFQHVTPVPVNENLAQETPAGPHNKIGFSSASGAYFVETNGGGALDIANGSPMADPRITAYRANAAAARFSRHVAQQFYRTDDRPYGYIYGGSGGAYRTIGSMENTRGVWDGGVPYVAGTPMAIPNMFTVRVQALRVLWDVFPQIIDAMEPGGSGDPYAGLTERQAEVLHEIENMGFPMESWYAYETMGIHGFAAVYPGVKTADRSYFTDFWTLPGYLGHDHPEYFEGARLQHSAEVAEQITLADAYRLGINTNASNEREPVGVDNAFEAGSDQDGERVVGYRLATAPAEVRFIGGDVVIESGANVGRTMPAARIVDDIVILGFADDDLAASVQPGDTIRVDNSDFLAMESYHRHQVPGPEFPVWDQFRDENGEPLYPQRRMLIGPLFAANTMGGRFSGEIEDGAKLIFAASLWDREAMPWQADWYRRVYEANGHDVRLYYTDHALHGDEPGHEASAHTVSYNGPLQQSLRVLAAWVEDGVEPPRSTQYSIANGQVTLPDTAAERAGLQPVVSLSVDGGDRIEVQVGEAVQFTGHAAAPERGGIIVSAGWDFEGDGTYVPATLASEGASSTAINTTHSYDEPGTYFVGLRATAQPEDALGTPYAQLINLDRVRVIVTQ